MAFYPNVTKCWKQIKDVRRGCRISDDTCVCKYKVAKPSQQLSPRTHLNARFLKTKTENQPRSGGSGGACSHSPRKATASEGPQPPRGRSRPRADPASPNSPAGTASGEQRNSTPHSPSRNCQKVTPPTALPLPPWGCQTGSDSCSGRLEDGQGKNLVSITSVSYR